LVADTAPVELPELTGGFEETGGDGEGVPEEEDFPVFCTTDSRYEIAF
jgi:hypothetical protein